MIRVDSVEQGPDQIGERDHVVRHRLLVDTLDCDPEVGEIRKPVLVVQDVDGANVAMGDPRSMGDGQCTADATHQHVDVFQCHLATHQPLLQRAAPQVAEHQERAARFAPVVVQRNDARVFEPCDQLCLGLEPTHEVGIVGALGAHDLHRDLAMKARLGRRVHRTVSALGDQRADLVAPHPTRHRGRQIRVVLDDLSLQRGQRRRGIQPGLRHEPVAKGGRRPKRLGRTPGTMKRDHALAYERLPQGVGGDEQLRFGYGFRYPVEGQQQVDPLAESRQVGVGQTLGDRSRPPLLGEPAQCRPSPEGETLVEQRQGTCRICGVSSPDDLVEDGRIGVDECLVEGVPGIGTDNGVTPDFTAQARHVGLQRTAGIARRVVTPQDVDQSVERQRPAEVCRERGYEPPLLRPAETNLAPGLINGRHRAEQQDSHSDAPLLVCAVGMIQTPTCSLLTTSELARRA